MGGQFGQFSVRVFHKMFYSQWVGHIIIGGRVVGVHVIITAVVVVGGGGGGRVGVAGGRHVRHCRSGAVTQVRHLSEFGLMRGGNVSRGIHRGGVLGVVHHLLALPISHSLIPPVLLLLQTLHSVQQGKAQPHSITASGELTRLGPALV